MFRTMCVMTLAGLVWTASGTVYSGQEPNPHAILEKAIKAHGGEANLAKYPAVTMKGKGTYYGMGEGIPYTAAWAFQGDTQQSFSLEFKVDDTSFKIARVINGDKGWAKFNDDAATELGKDELAEDQEKLYAGRLSRLIPLKDKSFQLAVIGEAKVKDNPAI